MTGARSGDAKKVACVNELQATCLRYLAARHEFLTRLALELRLASASESLAFEISSAVTARGSHTMVDGPMQNWLLESGRFNLTTTSEQLIGAHLACLACLNLYKTPSESLYH